MGARGFSLPPPGLPSLAQWGSRMLALRQNREGQRCAQGHTAQAGGPTLKASLTHRLPKRDLDWASHFRAEVPSPGRPSQSCLRPELTHTLRLPPSPNFPASKAGPWRSSRRPAAAGCSQRAALGAGATAAAGATGRACPSCQFHNKPSSCACAKGKLQLSKTKTPKGGTSLAALEDCWAPTRFRGLRGDGQGLGDAGSQPCRQQQGSSLAALCFPRWTGRSLGREGGT